MLYPPALKLSAFTSMFVLLPLISFNTSVVAVCVDEFEACVMPRDCCPGLTCVGGDWQYTTDSTCMSPLSAWLEDQHYSIQSRKELLATFYQEIDVKKTDEQLEHLVKKYRSNFPKLVAKLEAKYQQSFEIPGLPANLATAKTTTDEL